jgi:wyosine [tRNA(Phe)-imidazoG37] synthetase (radical SAM superfamily)
MMMNSRRTFFPLEEIINELEQVLKLNENLDVISVVGEGEPTLYLQLGKLIDEIHRISDKPVAVITNSALLYDPQVQTEIGKADIVLPTLDAYDEASFRKINRPHGSLEFKKVLEGLIEFSHSFQGELWLEIMLMKDINDDLSSLEKYQEILKKIKYNRLYLNTPVRPPAELNINVVSEERMNEAVKLLGGTSISSLSSGCFFSEIKDDYEAILSIIKRHPMNQHEIEGFLKSRKTQNIDSIIQELKNDESIETVNYKGFITFRVK